MHDYSLDLPTYVSIRMNLKIKSFVRICISRKHANIVNGITVICADVQLLFRQLQT